MAMDVLGLQQRFDPIPPPPSIRTGDTMKTRRDDIAIRIVDEKPTEPSSVTRTSLAKAAWDRRWQAEQFQRMVDAWHGLVTEALRPKRGSRLG
jgi:hypothetical protein